MLVLTETAAEVVKALTAVPEAPEGSGLRIWSNAPQPQEPGVLEVSPAAAPAEDDQVIEAAGAHVFVEPQAAVYLDDKVLDAQVDTEGRARFSLGMQSPGQV
jgi:Fe-S cluster assembly iron-binding protein IscA